MAKVFYQQSRAGCIEEASEIKRWLMPLLRLDTIPTLVQCIKFAEQMVSRGSENIRLPRLTLIGEEHADALASIWTNTTLNN